MSKEYEEKVQHAINTIGNQIASEKDWVALAMACLDQAGCSAIFQKRLARVIKAELWLETWPDE